MKNLLFIKIKHRAYIILSSFIALIIIGTTFYHYKENWSLIDSFYFSVTSLTTTGYGDLYPTQDITKIFTVFYLLIGVGVAVYALNILAKYYIDIRIQRRDKFGIQKNSKDN